MVAADQARSPWWGYLLAVIVTAATLGGRLAFAGWFAGRPALVLFVLPIFISAYAGGLGPGLLSTALVAVGSAYYLMPPVHNFAMDSSVDTVLWVVLILIGVLISVLMESLHTARRSAGIAASSARSLAGERKVQGGFGLALAFLVLIGVVSIVSVTRLREDAGWSTHTEEVIASLRLLLSNVTDLETAERGYIITGAENYLTPYDNVRRSLGDELTNLRRLTADNVNQQRELDRLMPAVNERIAVAEQNIDLRRRHELTGPEAAQAMDNGKKIHDQIRELIAIMEDTERGLLQLREDRVKQTSRVTRTVIIGGGMLAFVFVAVALFVMNREFAIRHGVEVALREARDGLEARIQERTAELERAVKTLRAGEARYRTLFDYAPDGIVIADKGSRYLDANASICRMLGYTREELVGLTASDILVPEETPHIEAALKEIESRKDHHREWRFRRKDGSTFPAEVIATQMPDGNLLGVIRDVTERRLAERALRESEELFSSAFRYSPECLVIVRIADRTVIRANEAVCRLWGSTPEEIIGRPTKEYTSWVSEEERLGFMQTLLASGENLNHETDLRLADGRLFRFNISSRLLTFAGERCILSVMSDITARRQAEEASARLVAIVESSDDAIIGKNLRSIVTSWNTGAEKVFGYSAQEMLGQSITRIIPMDRQGEEMDIISRVQRGESVRSFDTLRLRKDGTLINISVTISAIRDASGRVVGASKVARDITEQKKVQAALRESEERMSSLISMMPEAMFICQEGKVVYVNQRGLKLWRAEHSEQLLGRSPLELIHPDSHEEVRQRLARIRESGDVSPLAETRIVTLEGKTVQVETTAAAFPYGGKTAIQVIVRDISERKRAEEAMRESRERFASMFNSSPVATSLTTIPGGKYVDVNNAFLEVFQTTRDEVVGHTVFELSTWVDLRQREELFAKLGEGGAVHGFEMALRTKSGQVIQLLWSGVEVVIDGERCLLGSGLDITEKRKMEMVLRQKDELLHATDRRLAEIVHGMTEACFALDEQWRFTFVNERGETLLRHRRAEMLGRSIWEVFRLLVGTPMEQNYRRAMTERIPVAFEVFSPIAERWLDIRLFPTAEGLAAFLLDIQDRKMAEGEIQQLNTELENRVVQRTAELQVANSELQQSRDVFVNLFESLPGLYLVLDPELTIVTASDAYTKATMTTRAGLIGRGLFEAFPDNPEEIAATGVSNLMASINRVRATLVPDTMAIQKYDVRRPDGTFEERYWSPINSPVLTADRQIEYIIHRVEDVTDFVRHKKRPILDSGDLRARMEQMEAEIFLSSQKIQTANLQLEAANKELESFSYSVSHDLRTPLRAVDGFSQAVLEDYGPQLPDEGRRYLQTIRESAQRMGELIDDLLQFSRLSRQPLHRQKVDNELLVRTALVDLRARQPGQQVEIKTGALPACEGDPALLKQVWINLLSNAIKYSRRKSPAVVEVGCLSQNGESVYFVRDNGAGFDMKYAHKLFGVFQRLHRAEDYEGTGVGLAIVQRIIHRHGGRVWAEAAVDQGATFFFTLKPATQS